MTHHPVIFAMITALIATLDVLNGIFGKQTMRRNAWRRLKNGKPRENALSIVNSFTIGSKNRQNTTKEEKRKENKHYVKLYEIS